MDAVPALIQLLQHEDIDDRLIVAMLLGQIETPEAIKAIVEILPEFIQALQDEVVHVCVNATKALGRIGEGAKDVVPALIQLLQDQDTEGFVRANAARALGRIGEGTKDAVPALIPLLKDQDVGISVNAVGALGRIGKGSEDAVSALIQALQDQDADVRWNAAEILTKIGTPEALKAVEEYQAQQ